MNPSEHNPQEVEPRHGEISSPLGGEVRRGEEGVLHISYDQLSKEVRPYADNLEAQVWAVFAKYGVGRPPHPNPLPQGERESPTISPPLTGGDQGEGGQEMEGASSTLSLEGRGQGEGAQHPLELLKAANPSTEDLEHLADLLDQLDHIRRTGAPSERTKREYGPPSLEFSYNETEAKRLGLKRVEVKGYPEADALIQQVIDGTIDIETKEGQEQFMEAWNNTCPDLPPPGVPDQNNFWYLTQLKNKRIIKNLEGDPETVIPHFGQDEILLIDSWEEEDYDSTDAPTKLTSSLIQELLGQESVVNIKRRDLDAALWQGDPKDRVPTERHQAILEKLDMPPDDFELRLIRQDEYARLAKSQGWGNHSLWTNFDHYFLEDAGARDGLIGGHRDDGGPSRVGGGWRVLAGGALAVRLVLARKPR